MKKGIVIFFCLYTVLFSSEIIIATAANVSYVIHPLIQTFNQTHPNTKIDVIVGSSGKLTAQISHGAPYDIFLSANMAYPQALYRKKLTLDKPVVYAQGALVLLSTHIQNFSKGLKMLENAKYHQIAIANPKTAPYGVAAKEALEHAGLYEKLKEKFVYGESIAQTVLYATRVADIGIVAKSSLFAPQMKAYEEGKNWVDVNATLYTPIDQGMVLLRQAEENSQAQAFYDFILSPKAQEILKAYGYKVP